MKKLSIGMLLLASVFLTACGGGGGGGGSNVSGLTTADHVQVVR
ncbi:hypothetical protein SPONN_2668 [uncultured Candidatus Thioglobus sp.]|nr:hypothetical protein SPONL_891 [uncultured Candidatus Thioglobus sp.]SMN01613.1 hypothetical protein SPONN_2668 [uncultured Candidatus Thioglobus sp.]